MLRIKNFFNVFALSAVMFGAGVAATTVALSYLPSVIATTKVVAQNVKQSKTEEIDDINGWKWELQNCQRANQKVVCNFLVTNIGQNDNSLNLSVYDSRIFVSGSEYKAASANIGQSNSTYTNIIRGIPTKVNVIFNTPQEVTKLEALEVNYYSAKAQFRDVNISGSQASNPANPGKCTCPPQTNPKKPRQR